MKKVSKTETEVAREVINGMWGNGQARIEQLMQAGFDPKSIQKEVNQQINVAKVNVKTLKANDEIAKEVIQGKWGNGQVRKQRLMDAGYDYSVIQSIVNRLI